MNEKATVTTLAPPKPGTGTEDTTGVRGPRIRCPKCDWSPKPADLWTCECGHQWNTFDTGGVCPSCLRQWSNTQCLACNGWSAHSDWYDYR